MEIGTEPLFVVAVFVEDRPRGTLAAHKWLPAVHIHAITVHIMNMFHMTNMSPCNFTDSNVALGMYDLFCIGLL